MKTMKLKLPYIMTDWDRGKYRLFARRFGRKIRLREQPGSDAFLKEYSAALAELNLSAGEKPPSVSGAAAGTLGWLASCYFASPEFQKLESKTSKRLVIESCLREPRTPNSRDKMRDCPLHRLTSAHILMLRDRLAGKPGAANNRRKCLSAMFSWAMEKRLIATNPARDVKKIRYATSGFHTWTVEEVKQFEAKHPIGSKARLAMALMLYLGVRRGDVVTLGRQHVREETVDDVTIRKICFVPRKTRHKRQRLSVKPILPVLWDIIEASATGNLTFLVTAYGKPHSAKAFGMWFGKQCELAGLPHCSAHGLRKAGATIAANNGASDRMLMALYDWESASQANTYTAEADRERLARDAAKLIATDQNTNERLPRLTIHSENKKAGSK